MVPDCALFPLIYQAEEIQGQLPVLHGRIRQLGNLADGLNDDLRKSFASLVEQV